MSAKSIRLFLSEPEVEAIIEGLRMVRPHSKNRQRANGLETYLRDRLLDRAAVDL